MALQSREAEGLPFEDGIASAGVVGLIVASLIVTIGTLWAFERGAPDFSVFYTAWRLVLEGRGTEIYRESPDRFLYAPGFAWLLSPLAFLPRSAALALWCFAKAAVIGFVVREFQPARRRSVASIGMAAWGVALLARPLLIDFQYGQVNILILGACCWALLGHFSRGVEGWSDSARWFVLAIAAVGKVFPLPLLAVPWFVTLSIPPAKLRRERAGLIAGLFVMLAAPALQLGVGPTIGLLAEWRGALLARGLPFESHNQSLSALLHRWFSGAPVHVVALGMHPVQMGWALISESTLRLLSLACVFVCSGALVAWLMRAERSTPLRWIAVMVALLVLPSHLVWKPYFVMFLPIGVLLAGRAPVGGVRSLAIAFAFAIMNLSGFDFLGPDWGARAEAASVMLWASFIYLAVLNRDGRRS